MRMKTQRRPPPLGSFSYGRLRILRDGGTAKSRSLDMNKKTQASHKTKKKAAVSHPGMMGDGTEEQIW